MQDIADNPFADAHPWDPVRATTHGHDEPAIRLADATQLLCSDHHARQQARGIARELALIVTGGRVRVVADARARSSRVVPIERPHRQEGCGRLDGDDVGLVVRAPARTGRVQRAVLDGIVQLIAERRDRGETRAVPCPSRWLAERLGLGDRQVRAAVASLKRHGVVEQVGELAGSARYRHGVPLLAVNATVDRCPLCVVAARLDRVPGAVVERAPVAVERERLAGVGVDVAVPLPEQLAVRDAEPFAVAVDRRSCAPRDAALEIGHAPGGYADGRPAIPVLIERALVAAFPGTRNAQGFWLACQLRDNGYSIGDATEALIAFQQATPTGVHAYTAAEALESLRQAYGRSPRAPWRVRSSVASEPATGVDSTQQAKRRGDGWNRPPAWPRGASLMDTTNRTTVAR